jgi:UDP-glucose 4-epimerase
MGSHLTNELVERGHIVTVLDDLSGGFPENVDSKIRFIQGSVTDEDPVKAIFSEEEFGEVRS